MVRHRGSGPWSAGASPPTSAGCARPSVTAPTGSGPGCWFRPEDPTALAAALRAWLGDAGLRATVAPGRPRAARVALRVVDDRVDLSDVLAAVATMNAERARVSRGWLALREPADAAARAPRPRRAPRATQAGSRPLGDPRPRLRYRRDGPLARAPAAGAAALGHARLRRGPARGCRGRTIPAAPPTAPRSPSSRGAPTSPGLLPGDLAGATLITASALLDMLTEDELAAADDAVRRRRVSGAADAVRRRARRADPRGSPGPARWPLPSMTISGVRRSGADCSARTPSASPSRGSAQLGAEVLVRASPWRLGALRGRPGGGVVHRLGGCCLRAADGSRRRDRRLCAPTSGAGDSRAAARSPSTTPTYWLFQCSAPRETEFKQRQRELGADRCVGQSSRH